MQVFAEKPRCDQRSTSAFLVPSDLIFSRSLCSQDVWQIIPSNQFWMHTGCKDQITILVKRAGRSGDEGFSAAPTAMGAGSEGATSPIVGSDPSPSPCLQSAIQSCLQRRKHYH